jgi:hypothetical protein
VRGESAIVLHLFLDELDRTIRLLDTWEAAVEALLVVFLLVAVYRALRASAHRVVWWVAPPTLTALAFGVLVASTGRRLRELLSEEVNDLSVRAVAVLQLLGSRSVVILLACCTVVAVLAASAVVTTWQVSRSKSRALAIGVGVMVIFAPMIAGIRYALFQGRADVSACFLPRVMKDSTEYALSCLRVGCGTTSLFLVLAGASGVVVYGRTRRAVPREGRGALESHVLYGVAAAMAAAAVTVVIAARPYASEVPPPEAIPALLPCDCESQRGVETFVDAGLPSEVRSNSFLDRWQRASELAQQLKRTGSPSVFVAGTTRLDEVSAALATIRDHGVANVCLQGIDDPGFTSRVLGHIRAPRMWHVLASSVADPARPGRRVAIEGRTVADEVPAIVAQLRRGDPTMLVFDSPE